MAAIAQTPVTASSLEDNPLFIIRSSRFLGMLAEFRNESVAQFHAYHIPFFNDTEAKLPIRRNADGIFEFTDTKDLTTREVNILSKAFPKLRDSEVADGFFRYGNYSRFCNQTIKIGKGNVPLFLELMDQLPAEVKLNAHRILTSKQDYFTLAQVNTLYQGIFREQQVVKIGIYINDADKNNLGEAGHAIFPYLHLEAFDMTDLGQASRLLYTSHLKELHLYECENVITYLQTLDDNHFKDLSKVHLHSQYGQEVEQEFQRVCEEDIEIAYPMTKSTNKR
jgi:hypothetical protein